MRSETAKGGHGRTQATARTATCAALAEFP